MSHSSKQAPITHSGASYFLQGFSLIRQKGVRRFVLIPLVINTLLFSIAFYFVYLEFASYMTSIMAWLPSWLDWLTVILWPLAVLTILVIFSFVFSTVANWLAAPFNGLLSEKMEAILRGQQAPKGEMLDIVKDIPRTLTREWQKLSYYLPRALGFFIMLWILPILGQIIWFLFIAWMMAIQYKDYPFDNHKVPFAKMKEILKQNQGLSYSFGITVAVFSMIPIVNLIVMPVAICGATALWVDYYQDKV
ncbi:cysteine biosynthesis protein CysZ [Colwellia sp. MT41]|uniref:Sulfate transporter CysZ n=1 Tax=Colwellia marinimaniae TaxID=1513592 RepID=A0ABQ0MUF9_9GAMM|nr:MULTISPECIES: sulfate transporter CysZ [Colwellia]ALO35331.1 cysteine biosynthesis protein CysZ [Colwellia sp. MT41]GAW96008.1 sulfate transporter CysZ [Colwellia marinimaniae]